MFNTALIFPGQGSQYLGMCKDLVDSSSSSRFLFDKASEIFGIDLFSYCIKGSEEDLASTNIAQPVIFIHSMIIDGILKANKVEIKAVAGHSLGEYSGLVSLGIISLDACLEILKIRCKQMQIANQKNKGGMLAVFHEDVNAIKEICKIFYKTVVANINSHNQIIISGPTDQIEKAIKLFKNNNIRKLIRLNVSGAFHSPLMEEANLSLNKVINSVNFNNTEIPIYQNVSPVKNFEGKKIKNNLLKQLTSSVLWYQTIINMKKDGINRIIEVGPKKVLSKLVQKIAPDIDIISIDNIGDLEDNGFQIIR